MAWKDFRGTAPAGNPYGATANTGIAYGFKYAKAGDQVELTFDVFCYFDKNGSWSKKEKQTPKLLQHEQLHFDIAEIQARRLRKAFASATFTDNYKGEIKGIFDQHMKALIEMQQRYDQESDHSMIPEKQAEWEAYVRTGLEKTKGEAISSAVGMKL
ncbi:hypothetical protein BH24BAC1_BH24BAC1_34600 [soil metagenome]